MLVWSLVPTVVFSGSALCFSFWLGYIVVYTHIILLWSLYCLWFFFSILRSIYYYVVTGCYRLSSKAFIFYLLIMFLFRFAMLLLSFGCVVALSFRYYSQFLESFFCLLGLLVVVYVVIYSILILYYLVWRFFSDFISFLAYYISCPLSLIYLRFLFLLYLITIVLYSVNFFVILCDFFLAFLTFAPYHFRVYSLNKSYFPVDSYLVDIRLYFFIQYFLSFGLVIVSSYYRWPLLFYCFVLIKFFLLSSSYIVGLLSCKARLLFTFSWAYLRLFFSFLMSFLVSQIAPSLIFIV